jgi:hypothetical protein
LSLDGILALDITDGSFTKLKFAQFIDGLLTWMNPFPDSNSVIVMDNCQIHRSSLIQEMIQDRYVLQLSKYFISIKYIFAGGCSVNSYCPIHWTTILSSWPFLLSKLTSAIIVMNFFPP